MTDIPEWAPIGTAPELERVMVAGWQCASRSTKGYWWWGEDCVAEGRGIGHPNALLWAPIILPPLPEGPPAVAQYKKERGNG